jgi:hypothetical protein
MGFLYKYFLLTADYEWPFSNTLDKCYTTTSRKVHVVYTYIRGHAVAELVEALCYKPEGSGFESR